jgi:hypothetical protein
MIPTGFSGGEAVKLRTKVWAGNALALPVLFAWGAPHTRLRLTQEKLSSQNQVRWTASQFTNPIAWLCSCHFWL